jgi:hypothetical protein
MTKTRDERKMTKEKVAELAEVTGVSWCHPERSVTESKDLGLNL